MPTVLITGASTGIGRATALRLAGSGWTVFAGVRKAADGEALRAAGGERVIPVELDVTDHAQIERAARLVADRGGPRASGAAGVAGTAGTAGTAGAAGVAGTADIAGTTGPAGTAGAAGAAGVAGAAGAAGPAGTAGAAGVAGATTDAGGTGDTGDTDDGPSSPGRLDALVNNAGIGFGGPLELIPIGDLRSQLEVNVLGPVALTQALLPALRRARGRVLFISSIGGRVAMAYTAPYAASKHAIEAIGDALRVELGSSSVQVALIEPGSVATPIWDKSRAQGEGLQVPAELAGQYGHVTAAMNKVLEDTERRGVPPEQVAETIERALTARRMRARYLIGRDAKAMLLAKRLLPDHVFDRVARRALGV